MLAVADCVLVLIDVQEKLAAAMHEKEALLENTVRLVKGAGILGIPILWTEQNPRGLGPTVPEVRALISQTKPVTKLSFSCCGEEGFVHALNEVKRNQVLVAGIECHVCVYQTVADLVQTGHEVQVVTDAVSSRTFENKAIGLERIRQCGASLTSVETALFELLRKAEGDEFKQMLKVVK